MLGNRDSELGIVIEGINSLFKISFLFSLKWMAKNIRLVNLLIL